MKRASGIWVHVGLLAVAGALAWSMSARKIETNLPNGPAVDLWHVEPDQVRSAVLDSVEKRVSVELKHDGIGDYAVVTVDTLPKPGAADAGALDKQTPQSKRFIAVDGAEKVRQGLARFKVLRTIGKIDSNRASEFGFDKPEGTLRIVLAQGPRTFTIGASTPGGGNYYVRDETAGIVQVAVGDPIALLLYAESRMIEHELHGFKTDDVKRIAIQAGGKKRQLTRLEGKTNGWADATSASKEDETASNWVNKLTQLRISSYEEKFQSTPTPIVRVEFGDTKSNLGFVEVFKVQGPSDAVRYVVRSERTRWFAEVIKSQAEQLERDITLVAK